MTANCIHKAARLAFLALLMEQEQKIDTKRLAQFFGVNRRSIQRDVHDAYLVSFLYRKWKQ